ncbi:hypothetical protein A9Q81_22880 [Gammaproteobacteria bacterium 42_54_T18]|nr:hypothetical protein A9Q81_22880 [Gammaproteobacteria bacterium 42_54_T18]
MGRTLRVNSLLLLYGLIFFSIGCASQKVFEPTLKKIELDEIVVELKSGEILNLDILARYIAYKNKDTSPAQVEKTNDFLINTILSESSKLTLNDVYTTRQLEEAIRGSVDQNYEGTVRWRQFEIQETKYPHELQIELDRRHSLILNIAKYQNELEYTQNILKSSQHSPKDRIHILNIIESKIKLQKDNKAELFNLNQSLGLKNHRK